MKKISYGDCLLNAAIQLTAMEGQVSLTELQARSAHVEAWLHLGEHLKFSGWVDLGELKVQLDGSQR